MKKMKRMKKLNFAVLTLAFTLLVGCTSSLIPGLSGNNNIETPTNDKDNVDDIKEIKLLSPSIEIFENDILRWSLVEDADKYTLEVNDRAITTIGNSYNVSSLFTNTRIEYYARVKAIASSKSGFVDSEWSSLFPLKINDDTDDVDDTNDVDDNNNTTIKLLSPSIENFENNILRWSLVEGADKYTLEVNDETMTTIGNSYNVSSWLTNPAIEYYARVRAHAAMNSNFVDSDWSSLFLLEISSDIDDSDDIDDNNSVAIKLSSPSIQSFESNILRWSLVENADRYTLEINDKIMTTIGNLYDVSNLFTNTTIQYYARIKAIAPSNNDFVDSDWSSLFLFEISSDIDDNNSVAIKLLSPSIESFENNILRWSLVENADRYTLEINDKTITTIGNLYDVSNLFTNATIQYHARIKAIAPSNSDFIDSDWSELFSFKINNNDDIFKENRYTPNQVEGGLQYDYSISYNDEYKFYYFYLGAIADTPIFTSNAKKYNYDGQEFDVTVSKTTREEIIKTASNATETIDTRSNEHGVSEELKVTVGTEGSLSIFGKVTAEFETSVSGSHHWTHNYGTNITRTEEHTESYATEVSEAYNVKSTFSNESGFKKGYSYRETLFEVVDVFAIVTYDINDNKYTYEFKPYIKGDGNRTFVTEESDANGSFKSPTGIDSLEFDLDSAMDIIEDNQKVDSEIWSEEWKVGFDGGNGTESKPYQISTVEQLNKIRDYSEKNFILTSNINLANHTWEPIAYFSGVLNGNGFSLNNLTITLNNSGLTNDLYVGLFVENGGTIKNLTINNSQIFYHANGDNGHNGSGWLTVGILAATNRNDGIIDGVTIKNSAVTVHRHQSRYGIVTGLNHGTILKSKVDSSTLFGNGDSAFISGKSTNLIEDCHVTNSSTELHLYARVNRSSGGIVGYNENGTVRHSSVTKVTYILSAGFKSLYNQGYKPIQGYIVGHQKDGVIANVAVTNCTKQPKLEMNGVHLLVIHWDDRDNYFRHPYSGMNSGNPRLA